MPEETNNLQAGAMVIPRWFLWIMSGTSGIFLALFVPWGMWVTSSLYMISAKMDRTASVEMRHEALNKSFHSHLADPNIHTSMLNRLMDRMDSLEDRIEKIEIHRRKG